MARELKFRAWDGKKMIYKPPMGVGFGFDGLVRRHMFDEPIAVHPQPKVMQYTGVKDIEDKDIYEDDIVFSTDGVAVVGWNDFAVDNKIVITGFVLNPMSGSAVQGWHNLRVIGNVHEFHELMWKAKAG